MLRLLLTVCVLNVLLLALELPVHGIPGANWFALEAALLTGLFALLPVRRWSGWLAWVAGVLFTLLALLVLADTLTRYSLARPVNLYLDLPLASSVYKLIAGNIGSIAAIAVLVLFAATAAGLAFLVHRVLAALRGSGNRRACRAAAVMLLLAGGLGVAGGHARPTIAGVTSPAVDLAMAQARQIARTHVESRTFEAMLDNGHAVPGSRRLEGLADVDVTIGFIESYGVSAVFDDRYAPVLRPRLEALERRVAAAGLHMVTGTLDSPVAGGQSWLAHGSLLSGLWLNNQLRYDLLLASDRETLIDDFRRTGHETVAIMPAIVAPWPEGRRLGYDRILAAADIDYAGPPFNWVTMPDQFTWAFYEQEVRAAATRPVFAELALISSHAPWVPVLPVIKDWNTIGDGAVFRQWEGTGEAPEVLWRDHDRVREHYARSVDYALAVATGYAERHVDHRTLLILLGDHQPAPLITGRNAGAAVPVHVISGDPRLIQPFLEHGFRPGAFPASQRAADRMDRFREWLHAAFGAPPVDNVRSGDGG